MQRNNGQRPAAGSVCKTAAKRGSTTRVEDGRMAQGPRGIDKTITWYRYTTSVLKIPVACVPLMGGPLTAFLQMRIIQRHRRVGDCWARCKFADFADRRRSARGGFSWLHWNRGTAGFERPCPCTSSVRRSSEAVPRWGMVRGCQRVRSPQRPLRAEQGSCGDPVCPRIACPWPCPATSS